MILTPEPPSLYLPDHRIVSAASTGFGAMPPELGLELAKDPVKFKTFFWPEVRFHRKQWEVIHSVEDNDETYVVAANMVGKDYVAGFIAVRALLVHWPCRIITTSVKDDHLDVLWGEILRFIQTARYPLEAGKGGCLILRHRDISRLTPGKMEVCPISYLKGMVSKTGEGMSGHHAPYTLLICDEASGINDLVYEGGQGWMKRLLAFGNPNPCQNFFREAVKKGDLWKDVNDFSFLAKEAK